MRLPLLNRPELYQYYYVGQDGVPQFAVAELDGQYLSVAGYILASADHCPDVWVSVWVAAKGHNGVGLELMNELPSLLQAEVVACNNIRPSIGSWGGRRSDCTTITGLGSVRTTSWRSQCVIHRSRSSRT